MILLYKNQFKRDNVNFGLLYFEQPDSVGHYFGPNSPKMTETLKQLDAYLGYFIKKLMEAELYFNSNIILKVIMHNAFTMENAWNGHMIYNMQYVHMTAAVIRLYRLSYTLFSSPGRAALYRYTYIFCSREYSTMP